MCHFNNSVGALYIGVIVSAACVVFLLLLYLDVAIDNPSNRLYGVTCVQALYYWHWYPDDRFYLKVLVGIVFLLDTLHQALISHAGPSRPVDFCERNLIFH